MTIVYPEMFSMGSPISHLLLLYVNFDVWLVVHILAEEKHTSAVVCFSVQYVRMPP